nr:flavodoxin domain-containing protein [Clostridioides sp.]
MDLKTVVLYKSKYGATKKYANWLSEELSCDLIETDNARIDKLVDYDCIIIGGGLYAAGIAGLSFIKKNYGKLQDKKIIVFAVGASPYDKKSMDAVFSRNFKDNIKNAHFYYCRGSWDEEKMSFKDRTLCRFLIKSLSKKDSATYEPWEEALVKSHGQKCDWTDKEFLKPIIELLNEH